MTLERAIEILSWDNTVNNRELAQDQKNAIKLGIEALKFRQRWEEQEGADDFPRLPGETGE